MFKSLIDVIAFINKTQVLMYDKSTLLSILNIFTSIYIQSMFSKKLLLSGGLPIYIYACHVIIALTSLVISLWELA